MVATGALLQDRYCIEEPIKKTNLSAVYKAKDQRLSSTVAIKENCFNDEEFCSQFRREARLLANLRHPLLPKVSDHFTEDDSQFLVMEYIPGKDLREMLREREDRNEGPFEPDLALEWADQLLDVLEYLHGHPEPIVHRDIKPQNLKLGPRGEVVLLDFGLAKGSPTLSGRKSSSIHGFTFAYASLAQIRDEGTNPRSDLYSLGATLYHLMTGVTPPDAFERLNARASGYNPLRPAHELNPQVAPAVSAALDKAMALYPHERPSSAAELRQMLREAKQKTGAEPAAAAKPKKLALAPGTPLQKRYRLVELIKQTDASAVYKARDQRLGHVVILKEHSFSDGGIRRELRRKAQLLAGLHHPALPVVTDYFVSGDGLFLVTEYIPGKDLREALREREDRSEGPFEPDLALEWADQLLDVLEYLHGQEEPILHHGLKPQNLKLTPRGEVMLLDFGLAKGSLTLAGGGLHGSALTYASLEQIKGEEADPRSDLYSLGATLYRLMTGVTPRNAIERLEARASGYNPLRPAHEVNQQILPAVSAALDKAMALYPHERPSSAAELRQMLRQANRKTVIERVPRPQMPKWRVVARWPQEKLYLAPAPSSSRGDHRPVEGVLWAEAMEFCARLSRHTGRPYRLPSEAEWEYACRAGTTTPFAFGETITSKLANTGNYPGGSDLLAEYPNGTTPVGYFGVANAFGLYYMHGNVWEWLLDAYHASYRGAPTDGSAWEWRLDAIRVKRGGSWGNPEQDSRSARRGKWDAPDFRSATHGFRVVMSDARSPRSRTAVK
jgi:serine/threonine protein kinase